MSARDTVSIASWCKDVTDVDRSDFWSRVDHQESIRPCWEWRGTVSQGRPRHQLRGRRVLAHRAAYFLTYGDDPADKLVLHSCDNTLCVNPRHLRLGTQRDNGVDVSVAVELLRMFAVRNEAMVAKTSADTARALRKAQIASARRLAVGVREMMIAPASVGIAAPSSKRRDVGELSVHATISNDTAHRIRMEFWGGTERTVQIARRLGLGRSQIENVVRRKCFKEMPLVENEPHYFGLLEGVKARTKLARAARKEAAAQAKRANRSVKATASELRASMPVIRNGEVARGDDGSVVTIGHYRTMRPKPAHVTANGCASDLSAFAEVSP